MNYEEWEHLIPAEITNDSLWKIEAYRLGVFAADVGWHDATKLMRDKRTLDGFYQRESRRRLFTRHRQG